MELGDLPTGELLALARERARQDPEGESDERWAAVCELQRRGGREVYSAAAGWCDAEDPVLRRLGAHVLGQLGYEQSHPFARESEPILVGLLADPDEFVVADALIALGHLSVGSSEAICALAASESAEVRHSVAFCLLTRDDALSRATLVRLSADPDAHVRDWATFGLGAQSDVDSPAIREALVARLTDPDLDTRCEAMIGLAERGDRRAVEPILAELGKRIVTTLPIRAAALLPDRAFLPALESLLADLPDDPDVREAVERCRAVPPG